MQREQSTPNITSHTPPETYRSLYFSDGYEAPGLFSRRCRLAGGNYGPLCIDPLFPAFRPNGYGDLPPNPETQDLLFSMGNPYPSQWGSIDHTPLELEIDRTILSSSMLSLPYGLGRDLMRKDEIKIGNEYLTRYGYVAKATKVSDRLITMSRGLGYRTIKVHHSDLIREYNGGRDDEKDIQLEDEFNRLREPAK